MLLLLLMYCGNTNFFFVETTFFVTVQTQLSHLFCLCKATMETPLFSPSKHFSFSSFQHRLNTFLLTVKTLWKNLHFYHWNTVFFPPFKHVWNTFICHRKTTVKTLFFSPSKQLYFSPVRHRWETFLLTVKPLWKKPHFLPFEHPVFASV